MKIYAVIYYYYDIRHDSGNGVSYEGFCATKDIAKKHVEKLVAEIKREKAYTQEYHKIYSDNCGKPFEEFKPKLDKMREMFNNGYAFEYIPEEDERDVWIDDRYFPFICLDDDGLDYLEYEIDKYGDYDCEYDHYHIEEIEVIDAIPE